MKKLRNYLPFHFLLFFIIGICFQYYLVIWKYGFQNLFFLSISLLSVLFLFYVLKYKIGFTFSIWVFFFFCGVGTTFLNDASNNKAYYQNYLNRQNSAVLKITKVLKPSLYSYKFEAEVIQLNHQQKKGKILINYSKDSVFQNLIVDDEILINSEFQEINKPLNPHQFDYSKYLERQGIQQQVYIQNYEFKKIENKNKTLIGYAFIVREKIKSSLQKYNFSDDEFAVISALLLGERQGISKELSDDYANAGAIHILAVSGLHVGILLLVLMWLLKPIELFKNGKIIKAVLIVLFLWFFALLAGLSASVVRAVTMFTFLAIGNAFQSKKVIEFSLISSAFLLLLIKPMLLFDVGFQLSYLAVFGIVWMQPVIYQFIKSRFKVIDFFTKIISVSIAAQFAVLPLSLFYFHQFPGLFLVSNIFIIPVLGSILVGGILVIVLALLSILPNFLADLFGWFISLLNQFIQFVSHQESFLFEDISMSFLLMIASYGLVIFLFQLLIKVNSKSILLALVSVFCFQSVLVFEKYQRNQKKEFIVFHQSRKTFLGKRIGAELKIYSNSNSENHQFLTSYIVGEHVSVSHQNTIPNYIKFNDETILVLDSLGIYQLKNLENPTVLITNSPKINLNRLISTLKPKQIIADGSNYKSYIKNWKLICEKNQIDFKDSSRNGAVIFD